MPLTMNSRPVGEVMIVQCNGRIVAGSEVFSLQAHIGDILPNHGDVVLQLERVEFVDSSGLGALVRLGSTARAKGGDIKLCGVQPRLRKTLEMTSLLGMFEIYESEAEAIIAAYMGSRYSKEKSSSTQFRVLCVYDSPNVSTFLREVLCHAGYNVLTTGNLLDAKILLKATKAKLVILGAKMQSLHGNSAKKLFEEIDPSVSLLVLDADFEKQDPGESVAHLLESVRSIAQPEKTQA
ncbi:MAG TPA: anti-sigma factor antagonist [Terriglobales bacterium]|jgi:anti-sigma B factor antagonist|nr:anti-sigma factor antagonist [Terriglobales bacterium]